MVYLLVGWIDRWIPWGGSHRGIQVQHNKLERPHITHTEAAVTEVVTIWLKQLLWQKVLSRLWKLYLIQGFWTHIFNSCVNKETSQGQNEEEGSSNHARTSKTPSMSLHLKWKLPAAALKSLTYVRHIVQTQLSTLDLEPVRHGRIF